MRAVAGQELTVRCGRRDHEQELRELPASLFVAFDIEFSLRLHKEPELLLGIVRGAHGRHPRMRTESIK